jgi:molecular chaperone DnaJ
MSASDDFYSILGIPRSATQAEIKAAFKKLAMEHHPDVSKDPKAHVGFQVARFELLTLCTTLMF